MGASLYKPESEEIHSEYDYFFAVVTSDKKAVQRGLFKWW